MIKFPNFGKDEYLIVQEPDPDLRDKAYYLRNVKAFYGEYLNGLSTIGFDGLSRIEYLRAFAEGKQPIKREPLKPNRRSAILDQNGNPIEYDTDITPFIDWSSDVWDILSPANKIMDALTGALTKIDFEISCDPIDPSTRNEVEDNKLDSWQYKQNRKRIQFAAMVGNVTVPEPAYIPDSPEDLDQNSEKFLPDHARYIEQVVKHSFDISHWDPDTLELFYRDIFIANKACVKNEYDPEDGKVKPRYININTADIQRSKWIDHRDSERAWHFELINIATLRQYFPDKPEEFFKKAAASFAGYFDNPGTGLWSRYNEKDTYGRWGYDSFKCCVGNFEWIDINTTKEEISEKKGRKITKEVPLSSNSAKDKVVRFKDERMRFGAKWLVGTDAIYEYGPAFDATYPTINDTELTYKWISLPGKSKIEQLIPIFENFYDLWEKFRELLRNAQGRIYAIDIDMLTSAQGETDNPTETGKKAFRRLLSTDKFLFRRVNSAGMPNQNQPINETEGGMGNLFGEIQAGIKMNVDLVEYITGINALAFGQSADPNAPVTTSEMAMAATATVLLPLVKGGMRMKQMIGENLARWIVVIVRGNEFSRKAYQSVIGEYGIQALIAANKGEADYGFTMLPRPTDIEKRWILENLKIATIPQQGGEREISTADANKILNMLASGQPMKTIQYFFEKARKKQAKILEQKKMALMQQQSELNQKDAQVSGDKQKEVNKEAHDYKMEQIREVNKGLLGKTVVQEGIRTEKDLKVQDKKNEGNKPKE